ncbi:cardiolipin synthase [Methylobacillus rhizosphaerae]|uniref:Cardiolipin synthase B n=1 Tax=Methylobacillus rhizosphaerae TaxID=551994 RepID=A0A238XU09_9PROT|nr:cardiolipin synthase ClsB [Methylobacillus rhizosphaerae]SNR62192.1 cardiolipin synthase [Methylobacillus rhizosphaerae]
MRWEAGNRITLLRNGTEFFPALITSIESAQCEIYIQTYIYELDDTGLMIGNKLKAAAIRGVMVHLLLDGFGSRDLPPEYVLELEAFGIKVMFYRPKISAWSFKRSRLRRLHRKVSVFDGQHAYVGGINIIDDMNVPNNLDAPRVDYAVRVEGPLVQSIHASTRSLWRRLAWVHLREVPVNPSLAEPAFINNGMRAAFVVRDNVLHRRDIERAYLKAIGKARSEIVIASAYFVPGKKFRQALIQAAERGVRVRLLLQGRMEYWLMFATHEVYGIFLRHGIEIYEYRASFMHSKVAVMDNRWATVGSSNLDPFSLLLAREANILVQDKAFNAELKADLEQAIAEKSVQVRAGDWSRRHVFKRMFSWAVYVVVRLMIGLVGSKEKH